MTDGRTDRQTDGETDDGEVLTAGGTQMVVVASLLGAQELRVSITTD